MACVEQIVRQCETIHLYFGPVVVNIECWSPSEFVHVDLMYVPIPHPSTRSKCSPRSPKSSKTHQDAVRMNHHRVNSMPSDDPMHEKKKPSVVSPRNAFSSRTAPKARSSAQKLVNAR